MHTCNKHNQSIDGSGDAWQYNSSNATGDGGNVTGPLTNATTAGIVFNHTQLPEGAYTWNIECYDQQGTLVADGFQNAGYNDSNYTFHVDTIAPTIANITPGNGSLITNRNSTVFEVQLNDSSMNNGVNVSLYYRKSPLSWQHKKLDCFDNESRGIAPGTSNATSTTFCNTTIDLGSNISLGPTDTLQYFFNTTDLANNSGTNGTQSAPLTATVDETDPAITLYVTTLSNISSGTPLAYKLYEFNASVTDTNRNVSRVYATLGNSSGNYTLNQSHRDGDFFSNPGANWTLMERFGTTDNFSMSLNTTNFSDGGYTLYVNATDNANNSAISAVDINIDNTAPAGFQFGAGSWTNLTNTTQNFILANYTFTDNRTSWCTFEFINTSGINRTVEVGSNATHTNKTSCLYNLTGVPDGYYRYRVFVNDTANNTGVSSDRNVTIDNVAPTSSFNISENGTKYAPGEVLRVNMSFTDAVSGVGGQNCTITLANGTGNVSILKNGSVTMSNVTNTVPEASPKDGTGWCNSTITLPSNITTGENYVVNVSVSDAVGNNAFNDTYAITVDNTAPTITINNPVSGVNTRNLTGAADLINITVNDTNLNNSAVYAIIGNSSANMTLNGTASANMVSGPVGNWTALTQDGATEFFFTALNSGAYTRSGNFTIYLYAADTANNTVQTGFEIEIDNNASADFNYFVNKNTTFVANDSNLSQNYFFVNLTFNGNNTEESACKLEIVNDTSYNYTMTRADTNNTLCSYNLTSMPEGYYRYRVFVNDSAGNENMSEYYSFTLDTTNPVLTSPTPTSGSYLTNVSSGATNLNITVTDNDLNTSNATVYYRALGGGAYQQRALTRTAISATVSSCNTTADLSGIVGSGDTIEYFFNASDSTNLNNTGTNGTQAVPLTATVDEGGPVITLPDLLNITRSNNSNTSFAVNIYAVDSGVGLGGPCKVSVDNTSAINQTIGLSGSWCNGTISLANVDDGNHTLSVWLNDSLGNYGNATAEYGYNNSYWLYLDSSAPNSTVLNFTSPGSWPLQANKSTGKFNVSVLLNDSAVSAGVNGTGVGLSGVCLVSVGGTANQTVDVSAGVVGGLGWCNGTGLDLTGVSDGNATVNVWYNDSIGNLAANSTTFVWVDSTAPEVTMYDSDTYNETAHNTTGILDLKVMLSEPAAGIGVNVTNTYCIVNVPGKGNQTVPVSSLDTRVAWCNTSNSTLDGATEGNQTITVWANDSLDNIGSNETFRVWIDSAAPNVTFYDGFTNYSNKTTADSLVMNLSVNDSIASTGTGASVCLAYAAGQSANTSYAANFSDGTDETFWCNGTLSLASATAGINFLTLYANDTVNNTGNNNTYYAVRVDDTAPTVDIRFAAGGGNNDTNVTGAYVNGTEIQVGNNFTINVSVLDSGAGVGGQCMVYIADQFVTNLTIENISDGLGWCNSSVQVPGNLSAGNHSINISVRDGSGNFGSNTTFTVDATADSTDPSLVLYNSSHTDVTGTLSNATLAKGGVTTITFEALVEDSGSGLSNASPCYVAIGNVTASSSVTIVTESSALGWCNGTVTVPTGITDGNQTFNLSFADIAGNNVSNVTHFVDVDDTPPTVTFDFPGNQSNISGSTYNITTTIEDNHTTSMTVILKLWDGSANYSTAAAAGQTLLTSTSTNVYNTTFDTTGFADGNYSLFIIANDSINNINTTSINVTIDNTAPTFTFNEPADESNLTAASNIVNVTVTDDTFNVSKVYAAIGNASANYTLNRSGSIEGDTTNWTYMNNTGGTPHFLGYIESNNLQDGEYWLWINATDAANNSNVSSTNITIDNVNPGVIAWQYSFVNQTLRLIFNDSVTRDTLVLTSLNITDINNTIEWTGSAYTLLNGLQGIPGTSVQTFNQTYLDFVLTAAQDSKMQALAINPLNGSQMQLDVAASAFTDKAGNELVAKYNTTVGNLTHWGVDIGLTKDTWLVTSGLSQQVLNNLTWLGSNYTVESILASIRGSYSIVYYYNTTAAGGSNNWTSYVPGRPANDLVNVHGEDEPYYILPTADDYIQILPNTIW